MRAHTVFGTASVACAVALLTAILAATAPVASAQSCAFTPAESWQGAQLNRNADADAGAYFYVSSRVSIDADGAPNAYHPDNIGLDHVGNAGWPDKSWWRNVLVVDPADPSKA